MDEEQFLRKVKVEGGYLKFSSAHFITFGGKCERLHGHNYNVLVEIEGTLNDDKLVFDFTILKRLTKEICQKLNHRFLLPKRNHHLELIESPDAWEIHFQQRRYVFPRTDVVSCPLIILRRSAWLNIFVTNCLHCSLHTIPPTFTLFRSALKRRPCRWLTIVITGPGCGSFKK